MAPSSGLDGGGPQKHNSIFTHPIKKVQQLFSSCNTSRRSSGFRLLGVSTHNLQAKGRLDAVLHNMLLVESPLIIQWHAAARAALWCCCREITRR